MISIGPLYGQLITYPHRKPLPVVELGWTHEIEEPYRRGSCLVFRVPFAKHAIAVGLWREEQEETVALTAALWGRHLDVTTEELLEWD
jgi:hypothetical protein